MPALKLLLRRTLASTAVNPPSSILCPPPPAHVYGGKVLWVRGRSTLAKGGACLRISRAHVKGPTTTKIIKQIIWGNIHNNNNNIFRKRVFMLSSSSSSTSSSPFEAQISRKLYSSSSSSSPPSKVSIVSEMGDARSENTKQNDDDVGWEQNGVVLPPPIPAPNKDHHHHRQNQEQPCTKLLTLPTVLTLARVAAIPVFIGTFYANSWWGAPATTSIFVAAAITDWLDGYLARKMSLGTAFGAFLDPVADKLMVAATLVLLCSRPPEVAMLGDIGWLFPVPAIAIIGREITMSAVREWAASQDAKLLQAVAVNNLGKWKTATQMTALTMLLATRDSSVGGQGALAASGVALLYISAGLAVWSLVVYMRKIWKVLLR